MCGDVGVCGCINFEYVAIYYYMHISYGYYDTMGANYTIDSLISVVCAVYIFAVCNHRVFIPLLNFKSSA